MIVIALNPSYDPLNDENDEQHSPFYQALLENLTRKTINVLNFRNDSTYKWWKRVLKGIYNEGNIR